MKVLSPWLSGAIACLLIAVTPLIPIDESAVYTQTSLTLVRDLAPKISESATEIPVRLEIIDETNTPGLAERVKSQLLEPSVKGGESGWVSRFVISSSPASRSLGVRVSQSDAQQLKVTLSSGGKEQSASARLASWWSLLPPLLALIIAVIFRHIVWALFIAVLAGSMILKTSVFGALLSEALSILAAIPVLLGADGFMTVDGQIGQVLTDTFNLQILGFTFALVGMVGVIGKMGGTRGLVDALSGLAKGPRSAQVVTSAMGTAVFFDDYANTVVVGTTARSLTDKHRVSREKLAYIVDSTSAPVAGIAIISTWIGYEVGLFDDLLGTLSAVPNIPNSGYELFFEIIPLRFYCFFALALVLLSAVTRRDLGGMVNAERRVRGGGPVVPYESEDPEDEAKEPESIEKADIPYRAVNAIIPIAVVLVSTLGWIVWAGSSGNTVNFLSLASWKSIFDQASNDIGTILFCSALFGSLTAMTLALSQGLLTLKETIQSYLLGMNTLLEAAAILVLAWAIKGVCDDLGTGIALVGIVGDSLPALFLPVAIFLLSGLVAFCTGTSWGTMALVLPIAAPLSVTLSGDTLIVLACMGAVLDGAIWGDHSSPISDTTILSSTSTGCPHLAHVRTQLPYATLAMVAAGLFGYVGAAAGLPIWLSYLGGFGVLLGGLYGFGQCPDIEPDASS